MPIEIKKESVYDIHSSQNDSYPGIMKHACATSSLLPKKIKSVSFSDVEHMATPSDRNLDITSDNTQFLQHNNDEIELAEISATGDFLIDEVAKLYENDHKRSRIAHFTQKKLLSTISAVSVICLGGLAGKKIYDLLCQNNTSSTTASQNFNGTLSQGDSAATMMNADIKTSSLPHSTTSLSGFIENPRIIDSENKQINPALFSNEAEISQHEYMKEIAMIDGLSLSGNGKLYRDFFIDNDTKNFKRNVEVTNVNDDFSENEIIKTLQDESVDWRIRNVFLNIFKHAQKNFTVEKNVASNEKNTKFLMNCIELTLEFLGENRKEKLNYKVFSYGTVFLKKIITLLEDINDSNASITNGDFRKFIEKGVHHIFHSRSIGDDYDDLLTPAHKYSAHEIENIRQIMPHRIEKRIYKSQQVDNTTPQITDDVAIFKVTSCQEEREDITFSGTLRIISNTLKNPVSTLMKEGQIVLNYDVYGKGCQADKTFNLLADKIEIFVHSLLAWMPEYEKWRMISLIVGASLELIADAIEGKELTINHVSEFDEYLRHLSKDLLSSLSTKQINDMGNLNNQKAVADMIKKIKYNKNKLTIETATPEKSVSIDTSRNNFFTEDNAAIIYYDPAIGWVINNDLLFNAEVKRNIEMANKLWFDNEEVYFLKNSSPEIYHNTLLIKYKTLLNALVDGNIYPVTETQITNNIFRYTIKKNYIEHPIIQSGGEWGFEEESSLLLSANVVDFIKDNTKVRNTLLSKNIAHSEVTPALPPLKIHFNKNNNQYIKVANEYYSENRIFNGIMCIEGNHDLLLLKEVNNKLDIKLTILDGEYSLYRVPLVIFFNNQKSFFFDSSIITKIASLEQKNNTVTFTTLSDREVKDMALSKGIDGAIEVNGNSYISFERKLIKITKKQDDSFVLCINNNLNDHIRIYKNPKSDTYYLLPNMSIDKEQVINNKSPYIPKRSVIPSCKSFSCESQDVKSALKMNEEYGLTINNPSDILDPLGTINGFYKEKINDEIIYYRSQNGLFFYAKENADGKSMVPTYFNIYAKNKNNKIDNDFLIIEVSVIKDFDTKNVVVTTPSEALEEIFNLGKEASISLLKWQKENSEGQPFSTENDHFIELQSRLSNINSSQEINRLFFYIGKKIITSVNNADISINSFMDKNFPKDDGYLYKSLSSLNEDSQYSSYRTITNDAFERTKYYISNAINMFNMKRQQVNDHINDNFLISNQQARDLFINAFTMKLHKMDMMFNNDDKSNIILIMHDGGVNNGKKNTTNNKEKISGFSFAHDPLDRIFINMDFIVDLPNRGVSVAEAIQRNNKHTNTVSNIMCYESVPTLGNPENHFHHMMDDIEHDENVPYSFYNIESYLLDQSAWHHEFIYLCKLYFISNPVYKNYNLEDLLKPSILSRLFQHDDFLRAIIIINDPTILSRIVNDLMKAL